MKPLSNREVDVVLHVLGARFKKGDKVRMIAKFNPRLHGVGMIYSGEEPHVGDIGVVHEVLEEVLAGTKTPHKKDPYGYCVSAYWARSDNQWWVGASQLELVNE